MSESSKALSRRFTELFSTDDLSLADDVLAEDVVFHGAVPGGLRGIDAVKGFLAAYRAAFPDAVSTVEDQVAEGDTVVTRWRARHPRRAARRPARDRPRVRHGRHDDGARRRRADRRGVGRARRARPPAPARRDPRAAARGRGVDSASTSGEPMRPGAGLDNLTQAIVELSRSGHEPAALRDRVLPRLRRAVPFDAAFWTTADPVTLLFTGPYQQEIPPETVPYFVENEILADDVNKFTALARDRAGVRTLAQATGGALDTSARHRDVFRPLGLGDELRAALRAGGACWASCACTGRRARRSRPPRSSNPGVGGPSAGAAPPRLRMRTRSGRWAVLHASRLPTGGPDAVAVIIDEPSPAELAPVLMMAYGLTTQEQTVTGLVCRGLSTREIGERLRISAHTVQDHLKAIFDKTGVRSRRELVAAILQEQYLPRAMAGRPLGRSGFFAGD